ncbi:MAG: hypothetical protein H6691_09750 [Gemmatimonadales bacterium]|nr:hypothetical protein [Gemmatimonadales bacterium]
MPSPSRLTLCTLLTVTPLAAQATRSPELISVTTADLPTLRNTPRATAPESVIGGAGVRSFAVSPAGVIVVDNGERQLRVIAPDGSLLRTIGRAGEGPGEFSGPLQLGWLHDTLVVVDPGLARVTLFRAITGDLLATVPTVPPVSAWVMVTLADRLYGISPTWTGGMRETPNQPGRRVRALMSTVIPITARGPAPRIPLLSDSLITGDGFDCEHPDGSVDVTAFFPDHGPLVTVLPGPRLVTATRDSFLLTVRAPGSATPTALIRDPGPRQRVTDRLWDAVTAPWRDAGGRLRCGAELPRPAFVPVVRALQGDGQGRLWVEVSTPGGTEVRVLEGTGRGIGRFPMPGHVIDVPWQVRDRILYVVVADADGLQEIRSFRVGVG